LSKNGTQKFGDSRYWLNITGRKVGERKPQKETALVKEMAGYLISSKLMTVTQKVGKPICSRQFLKIIE